MGSSRNKPHRAREGPFSSRSITTRTAQPPLAQPLGQPWLRAAPTAPLTHQEPLVTESPPRSDHRDHPGLGTHRSHSPPCPGRTQRGLCWPWGQGRGQVPSTPGESRRSGLSRERFCRPGSRSEQKYFPWPVRAAGPGAVSGRRSRFPIPLPLLFLIGTLMRAPGVDPLPGGRFMPRLSHSPCKTKITRQAEFHWLVIPEPTVMD